MMQEQNMMRKLEENTPGQENTVSTANEEHCHHTMPQTDDRPQWNEELRIFVDGNKTASGDGFSAGTALASGNEAFALLARCNHRDGGVATIRFAPLAGGREYAPIRICRDDCGSLEKVRLQGNPEGTKFSLVEVHDSGRVEVRYAGLRYAHAHHGGTLYLSGEIRLRPNVSTGSLGASFSGTAMVASHTAFIIEPGVYPWIFRATSNGEFYAADAGICLFFDPDVHFSRAFIVSEHSGICHVNVPESIGAPRGKRFIARFNGGIVTKSSGKGLMPGSEAGLACHGGYYY